MGKVKKSKALSFAGAFIALLIGSGFATGQEVMQYFSSFGLKGIMGTVLAFFLLAYVGMSFISTGYREQFNKGNEIYKYYCGKYLGKFYDFFSIFFIFLSLTVMIAGAGATGQQHYGWNPIMGGLLMGFLTVFTVTFGLGKIVEVIGNIGPVIVVLSIIVSILTIIKYGAGLSSVNTTVDFLVSKGELHRATSNWILAAGSYVGFCMLWLASFLAQTGKTANNQKEAKTGAVLGALGFSVAVLLMTLALLTRIKYVAGSQIPSLILAGELHSILANIFSIIIFVGIYTTSVPLLWSVASRFTDEGTKKFKIYTIVIGAVAMVIGLNLEFDTLVSYVYVVNGFVGLLLLGLMIVKSIKTKQI
ncbi:MAG: hypothetical protein Q4P34_06075 [Tissierellia bacterium]|nr:hypothetical protein [Tissierellia bacterium]